MTVSTSSCCWPWMVVSITGPRNSFYCANMLAVINIDPLTHMKRCGRRMSVEQVERHTRSGERDPGVGSKELLR